MSWNISSSVCACSVTTHGVGMRVATTRASSPSPTAQTSHTDCPISTSGRRCATKLTSTSTGDTPAPFAIDRAVAEAKGAGVSPVEVYVGPQMRYQVDVHLHG